MNLLDEVVAITRKVQEEKNTEKERQEALILKEINEAVLNEYPELIRRAELEIRSSAFKGEVSCIIIVSRERWDPSSDNIKYRIAKKLGVRLLDWLEENGFSDIDNISTTRENRKGGADQSFITESFTVVSIKVCW